MDNNYVDIKEKEFPIRIFTRFENIEWDIHNEEDWKVVEEAIQSMKRRWVNGKYSISTRSELPDNLNNYSKNAKYKNS